MQRPSISAPPSAPVKRSAAADAEQFYEEKDPEAGLVPLSVICFVLSAVLMMIQILGSDSAGIVDTEGGSPFKVPAKGNQKWETVTASGAWTNQNFSENFKKQLLPIP